MIDTEDDTWFENEKVFRAKFVDGLRRAHARDELDFAGATATLRDPARWQAFVDALVHTDWSSMRSRPSAAPRRCCDTSAAIRIASPSAITD
jgi:hypothetical protein